MCEKKTLTHCWWECKLVQPVWKSGWRSIRKLKINLPYDPAVTLSGIYPKKYKSMYKWDTYNHVYCSSLHNNQTVNQLRCPTTDEYIKKILYIYMCVYIYIYICVCVYIYTHHGILVTKKNKSMLFARKWMELEIIMLTKISQAQKSKYLMFSFIYRTWT
jgi:hypothetical protein